MKIIKKVLKKKRGRPFIRLKAIDRKKLEKRYGSVQRAIDYLVTNF